MLIRHPADIPPSEITPPEIWRDRRRFLAGGAALALGLVLPGVGSANALGPIRPGPFASDEKPTGRDAAISYNNFYEFGTGKDDPKRHAHRLRTRPWSVA